MTRIGTFELIGNDLRPSNGVTLSNLGRWSRLRLRWWHEVLLAIPAYAAQYGVDELRKCELYGKKYLGEAMTHAHRDERGPLENLGHHPQLIRRGGRMIAQADCSREREKKEFSAIETSRSCIDMGSAV